MLSILCLMGAVGAVDAATITLDTSGNWSDGSNWDLNRAPRPNDDAIVGNGLTATSSSSGNVARSLTVSGKDFAILNVTGGSLSLGNNANATDTFLLANRNNHTGIYNQSGGDVTVNGEFNVATANRATGIMNLSGGSLTVNGDMTLSGANSATSFVNLSGSSTLTVNGTLDMGPAGNPQNFSMIVNNSAIVVDDIIIGSTSVLTGTGSVSVDNTMTLKDGAVYGLSIGDGLLLNNTTIAGDLFMGESAGESWDLLISDFGGLDEIDEFDVLTIFSVEGDVFVNGTQLTGVTDLTNVNLVFDPSVTAAEQEQFANAVVRYDPNTGEVYITNIVPLPNAWTLGLAALLGALIYYRPSRNRTSVVA